MPLVDIRAWTILGSFLCCGATLRAEPARTQPSTRESQENVAALASNAFAFDLYGHLAGNAENAGKNLFFSPYSISVALTMAAEGARGETAEQMGRALHFPATLHRGGADGREMPWDMGPIRTAIAALNEQLIGYADRPEVRAAQARIDVLRKELDAANEKVTALLEAGDSDKAFVAHDKAQKIADELNELYPRVSAYELRIANALWVEELYPMRQAYVDTVNRFYGGGAFPVDFLHHADAGRRQINAWVERQTGNRIRDLVPPDSGDMPTAIILTNAVSFRGEWLDPFFANETKNEEFAGTGPVKVRVPMMQKYWAKAVRYAAFNADGSYFVTPEMIPAKTDPIHGEGLYPGKGGFTMVEIPYKGDRLCMIVIAPTEEHGLDALEKNLTATMFDDWMGHLVRRDTHMYLPKFKVEGNLEMGRVLKSMGMERAFIDPRRGDGAQFDGMCVLDDPLFKPCLSDVMHKATVEVNEKGTEAAAATWIRGPVFGAAGGRRLMKPFTPTFRADRPFVFAIRDSRTGAILFLGRVSNPAQ